jgi:hypothetical protein
MSAIRALAWRMSRPVSRQFLQVAHAARQVARVTLPRARRAGAIHRCCRPRARFRPRSAAAYIGSVLACRERPLATHGRQRPRVGDRLRDRCRPRGLTCCHEPGRRRCNDTHHLAGARSHCSNWLAPSLACRRCECDSGTIHSTPVSTRYFLQHRALHIGTVPSGSAPKCNQSSLRRRNTAHSCANQD